MHDIWPYILHFCGLLFTIYLHQALGRPLLWNSISFRFVHNFLANLIIISLFYKFLLFPRFFYQQIRCIAKKLITTDYLLKDEKNSIMHMKFTPWNLILRSTPSIFHSVASKSFTFYQKVCFSLLAKKVYDAP